MKLDAHPLVVAVAMGLLNPAALVDVEDDEAIVEHVSADESWEPMFPAPDEAELHRVEIEWLKHQ
ncbi:MAG: hypothetical protein H6735_31195 [Alphaproteobacteria bacterium]|nr:hypothetical protein [Alphaproteobacteria bacterium]